MYLGIIVPYLYQYGQICRNIILDFANVKNNNIKIEAWTSLNYVQFIDSFAYKYDAYLCPTAICRMLVLRAGTPQGLMEYYQYAITTLWAHRRIVTGRPTARITIDFSCACTIGKVVAKLSASSNKEASRCGIEYLGCGDISCEDYDNIRKES